MAIDKEMHDMLYDVATKAMDGKSGYERAMLGFLGAILSEVITTRKIQEAQLELLQKVSVGGASILVTAA